MSARVLAIAAAFLLVRVVLLLVREPFFDELYTVWMAHRPLGGIVPALMDDSGPPLYYLLARIPNVFALRVMSLAFATATLVLILTRRSLGNARFVAAALLAFYPPAALFAVDARSYALCGLFIAIGVIAIHEERPFVAAGAFLLAAYTHSYGALFLPLVLLAKPRKQAVIAFAIAGVLFVPGLYLAAHQPVAATAWLAGQKPMAAFPFAGQYPAALFKAAPFVLVAVSFIVMALAAMRSWAFAPIVFVPPLLAVGFAFAGRNVYFPMRFESLIAVPLVLWLATSLERWPRTQRVAFTAALCACGALAIAIGAIDHDRRPLDPYREAAMVLAKEAGSEPILASGYLYLEAVHQLGSDRVRAYPAEQARHPGWRVAGKPGEPLPSGSFLWIAEVGAPELLMLRRQPEVIFVNNRAVIARVSNFHP